MEDNRRLAYRHLGILLAFSALLTPQAVATLGEDVSSINSDQSHLKAWARILPRRLYSVHEMQTPSGITIRQFVSPEGRVFAISWRGAAAPNLRQLLGSYFDEYEGAAGAQTVRRGHTVHIESGDLVVEAGGHMRFHVGRALLKSQLPQGVRADEIR